MLFQHLFKFQNEDLKQAERRLIARYEIAKTFPLRASVATPAGDIEAGVADLSAGGVGLAVDRPLPVEAGTGVQVNFALEDARFTVQAVVRHTRQVTGGSYICGVELVASDLEGRRRLMQLLIPVSIGSSLKHSTPSRMPVVEPNLDRLTYMGESDSTLLLWCRSDAGGAPDSFEFSINDNFVRGRGADRSMRAYSYLADDRPQGTRDTAQLFSFNSRLDREILKLFRWSMLNLQDNMPAAHREFLQSFELPSAGDT